MRGLSRRAGEIFGQARWIFGEKVRYNPGKRSERAGSVVTRDIPANVVAAGNPCRVVRAITEKDKTGYPERR